MICKWHHEQISFVFSIGLKNEKKLCISIGKPQTVLLAGKTAPLATLGVHDSLHRVSSLAPLPPFGPSRRAAIIPGEIVLTWAGRGVAENHLEITKQFYLGKRNRYLGEFHHLDENVSCFLSMEKTSGFSSHVCVAPHRSTSPTPHSYPLHYTLIPRWSISPLNTYTQPLSTTNPPFPSLFNSIHPPKPFFPHQHGTFPRTAYLAPRSPMSLCG